MTGRRQRGFTLLEVMIALALLGFGLTVLIKSAAGNIYNAQQAHLIGVATDLARGKMYDIEDKLIKDGFSDTEQHEDDQAFTDEGWPQIKYSYKIEVVELPGFEELQQIAAGKGKAGSGAGSGGTGSGADGGDNAFQNSALGGMLSQFGPLGGGGSSKSPTGGVGVDQLAGGSFIQSQYTMFQQILKVSLRKVTLTLKWQVMGSDRDMSVVAFFTDAGSMDKVISGMGSQDLDDANAAKASNKGSSGAGGGGSGSNLRSH